MTDLRADALSLAYDDDLVVRELSLELPASAITAIVGANACGKSTLLRGMARLLKPRAGAVLLDGQEIARLPTKEVAKRLGLLPQAPVAPEGLTVEDLVARGRYPHQSFLRQWSRDDQAQVEWALEVTASTPLRRRPLDELSGGQRQRAWIAMALAQDTAIMLLDEPTTFLDLAHQVEVLDLLAELNTSEGRTVVCVLHDLNQACRYAHHLVAMANGGVVAEGPPAEVVTEELVADVFGLGTRVVADPVAGTPLVIPLGRHGSVAADKGSAPHTDPNLERLAALEPEILVLSRFVIDELGEGTLRELAELVVIDDDDDPAARFLALADAFDARPRADALLTDLDQAIAAAAEALDADGRAISVATVYPGRTVAAWVDGPSEVPSTLLVLGFTLEPGTGDVPAAERSGGRTFLSLEQLGQLGADILVILQSSLVEGEDDALAEMANDPLWSRLPAVVNDNVVTLDRLGYPGIPGRIRLVDELTRLLA